MMSKDMMKNELFDALTRAAIDLGAHQASVIRADQIETDRSFRDACASNACGMYGRCHMCPPDVGDIDALMDEISRYDHALVYQTVSELEDSYDYEGMVEARRRTYPIAQSLRKIFAALAVSGALHLGAGGCGVCEICSKRTGEPCRYPELAMPSLEAYGVNVSSLAAAARMKYTNGRNTVTYFGAVLFCLDGEDE